MSEWIKKKFYAFIGKTLFLYVKIVFRSFTPSEMYVYFNSLFMVDGEKKGGKVFFPFLNLWNLFSSMCIQFYLSSS